MAVLNGVCRWVNIAFEGPPRRVGGPHGAMSAEYIDSLASLIPCIFQTCIQSHSRAVLSLTEAHLSVFITVKCAKKVVRNFQCGSHSITPVFKMGLTKNDESFQTTP